VASCPVATGRPRFEVADIVRAHRARLEPELSTAQRRVLSALALCRTAELGGHVEDCPSCGYEHPAYNSCRNRHCPKCQHLAQERWIAARSERLLAVAHFHVVFTLPSQLRPLAKAFPRAVYSALFEAASQTLLELDATRLQATLGATLILHTWARDLTFHPHIHALVTAGGLAFNGSHWVESSLKYLFPVEAMGALLRGKMMAALHEHHEHGDFQGLDGGDPEAFDRLMARLPNKPWHVYAKRPFGGAVHVLSYLGRYTHRVGIANSRLVDVTLDAVTFRTKNGQTVALEPVEFLRRFVQHVLPDGFKKIRHYGLYAGASAKARTLARTLVPNASTQTPSPAPSLPTEPSSWVDELRELTGRDVQRCPVCGGPLTRRPVAPTARSPPRQATP
jgi:hypothetical protein